MTLLGVNIDHVATVRNARGGREPDPVAAAAIAELNGADQITVHLREDRRHITDRDLRVLRETVRTRLNLEMAISPEIVKIALDVHPDRVTLVPERRAEITTEGGLDCRKFSLKLAPLIKRFKEADIGVSLFLDPDLKQLDRAEKLGADMVEIHTGAYANARTDKARITELERIDAAAIKLEELGIRVMAGHGLDYWNISPLLKQVLVEEVNIGHAIVSRAVFVGLGQAVREMKDLVTGKPGVDLNEAPF
ncbi:MAG: pyridoxine 5'-phosphate synthase [Planctomycetes bacterium]|nr:pyridoxine 5'-phosphate synthase [Planctomycetota bacterium]